MLEPRYLKIDMDVVEGISRRIDLLHEDGESYAELWAEFSNKTKLFEFDEDTDQNSISFQRDAATLLVLAAAIADEYMETQGWIYDRTEQKWKEPAVPERVDG